MGGGDKYLDRIERRDLLVRWRDGNMTRVRKLSELCALFEGFGAEGMTTDEIARILGHKTAARRMLSTYPELRWAYQNGMDSRTVDVEAAMLKRALGFTITKRSKSVRDMDGRREVLDREEEVYYPPDTAAGKFLLSNREKERFSDGEGNKMAVVINLDAAASKL